MSGDTVCVEVWSDGEMRPETTTFPKLCLSHATVSLPRYLMIYIIIVGTY